MGQCANGLLRAQSISTAHCVPPSQFEFVIYDRKKSLTNLIEIVKTRNNHFIRMTTLKPTFDLKDIELLIHFYGFWYIL